MIDSSLSNPVLTYTILLMFTARLCEYQTFIRYWFDSNEDGPLAWEYNVLQYQIDNLQLKQQQQQQHQQQQQELGESGRQLSLSTEGVEELTMNQ